jgi:hypothetical protein
LDVGADQRTLAAPSPAAASTFVGALGTVAGVTATEGADAWPVPTALVAVTVKA